MKLPHLFEFMDLKWLPASLHATLREILECGNARPFRPYYEWVARHVKRELVESKCKNIIELGAGTAPITRVLARDSSLKDVTLIVCDSQPDAATYTVLEKQYPRKVVARYDSVDFAKAQEWPSKSLLVLSGACHHIPSEQRAKVLETLAKSGDRIILCEPLRKTLSSVCFVFGSIVPAAVLPLWFINRPGRLRRFFWCWLLPVAPLMFWWDGWVSCLRMWNDKEWRDKLCDLVGRDKTLGLSHSMCG
jgi:hypothetical protein